MNPPSCTAYDPRLFDSTDWADHAVARAICTTCPAVAWCVGLATGVARSTYSRGEAPNGTWGGQLWRNGQVVTRQPVGAA